MRDRVKVWRGKKVCLEWARSEVQRPVLLKRVTELSLKSLPSSLNSREHQHQLASDAVFGEARSHPGALGTGRHSFSGAGSAGEGRTEGPHPGSPLHTQLKCTWIWGRWWQTPTSDSAAQRQGNVRAAAPHCDKASAMSQNRHARLQESRVHSPFPAFGREQVSFLKGLQSSRRRHRPRQSTTGLPAATQDSNRAAMATPSDCPCSSLDRSCKRVTASVIGEW